MEPISPGCGDIVANLEAVSIKGLINRGCGVSTKLQDATGRARDMLANFVSPCACEIAARVTKQPVAGLGNY